MHGSPCRAIIIMAALQPISGAIALLVLDRIETFYAGVAGSFLELECSSAATLSSSTSFCIAAKELPILSTILIKSGLEMPRRLQTDFTCLASAILSVVRIGRGDFTRNIAGLLIVKC